jgi:peptide/nickel transport system substrate-binding protein
MLRQPLHQRGFTRRDILRRTALATGVIGSGLVLACTQTPPPETPPTSPPDGLAARSPKPVVASQPTQAMQLHKGGHLVEGYVGDVRASMLPLFSGPEVAGFIINNLLFDGLLNSAANGDLVPLLASSLPTLSSDQLTMTFRLKPGVKWTDGQAVTADDVVFTYRVFSAPEYREANTTRRADFDQYFDSVSAPDPLTIVFKFKQPWAPFITWHCQYGIVPKHVLGSLSAKELNTTEFNARPTVSNGMFRFVSWDRGQQVVLQRNPDYYRAPTPLDSYTMKILATSTAVASGLQTGEIDMGIIDATVADQIKSDARVAVTDYSISAIIYLFYQLDAAKPGSKYFSDKRVRQALLYALDRKKMAQALFFGAATPGDSIIPPVTWAYDSGVTPKYPFDRTRAERLLDEAGWTRDASGTRAKDGTTLQFELLAPAGSKPLENSVVSMQQQWQAVGACVTPKLVDANTLTDVATTTRAFDAMVGQRNMPQDPDPSLQWTSANAAPGGFNSTGYRNPTVDKLIQDANAVFDQNRRKAIYSQLQNLLAEELPAAPLFVPREVLGVNRRVQGVVGNIGTFNRLRRTLWFNQVGVSDAT